VKILLGILGFFFAIWLILFITKGRFLKRPFEQIVGSQLERDVRVGGDFQLYFAPFSIKLLAEKARIANLPWANQPDLFRADLIDARIAPFSLLFGDRARLSWLELRNGAVDLEWSRDHKQNTWTLGDPNSDGEPMTWPLIRQARLAGTTLRYRDPQMQLNADIGFETVQAKDTRFASDVRLSGTGSMRGKPFDLKGSLLSPNATVSGGKNSLVLRAEAGATVVDVTGTLREVSPLVDAAAGTVAVKITIDDSHPYLTYGDAIRGTVTVTDAPRITLPYTAMSATAEGPAVWVVDPDTMAVSLRQFRVNVVTWPCIGSRVAGYGRSFTGSS